MHSDPRPPVTILCGFLGAGKTTLLNHLLGQTEGERWALVVNDVAAVNMDARQVAVRVEALSGVEAPPIVELGNGCVCCSSKDDLADSLIQLALTGRPGGPGGRPYDRIVVETTGVAEPKEIARLFTQRNPFGRSPGDVARLAALVTVVDAGAFLRLWRRRSAALGPTAFGASRGCGCAETFDRAADRAGRDDRPRGTEQVRSRYRGRTGHPRGGDRGIESARGHHRSRAGSGPA